MMRGISIGDVVIEEIGDEGVKRGGGVFVPRPDELPNPPTQSTSPVPVDVGNIGGGDFNETINNVNLVLDTLDRIINIAEKIWGIIEKNQPVVDINVKYANAVPYGIQHWTQLQGWSKPKTKTYSFVAKNLYGISVVKVVYQLQFRHSGNYQGKGKFLTGVTIEPVSVETLWGYKVSLVAEVPDSSIANVGTHEDPIASMQVQLRWTIHTPIKDVQQRVVYYVQGDGKFWEVASPFKRGEKAIKVGVELLNGDEEINKKIKSVEF